MGWFKVHSDDLHKVSQKEREPEVLLEPEEPIVLKVRTRDVAVYIADYGTSVNAYRIMRCDDPPYISARIMTKTNARDAFLKAAQELANHAGFREGERYEIHVRKETIKEPI